VTIPATLGPGDKLEAQAGVTLNGHGTYVDVSARTNLHVHVDPVPSLDPAVLFYGDDPEYVAAALSGVLVHGTIDANSPARVFSFMTDGAASYPIRFRLSATAPLPVGPSGCTPTRPSREP
jgi:hypothetical protein